MDPKNAQAAGKPGGKKSRKELIAEEEARRAAANANNNGKSTPAPVAETEMPKSSLLDQLNEILEPSNPAPTETPQAKIDTTEEVTPVVTTETEEITSDQTPAIEPEVMRIGENELIALIDERLNLAIAPIQTEVKSLRVKFNNSLEKVNNLFDKLAEIDLANSQAVDEYVTPATQRAFGDLVNEFWNGKDGWKETVGDLLSVILELKGKVEKDENDRVVLNRAKPALELLTQLPEVRKEIQQLIDAATTIESRIAAKVAELKGGNAQTPAVPTSRFASANK